MVSREDEGALAGSYILGMQLLGRLRARVSGIDPVRFDVLVAVLFLIEAELEVLFLTEGGRNAAIAAAMQVVLAAGLALRRVAPFVSLLLALGAFLGFQPLGRGVNDNLITALFAVLFILFSFGLHERDGRRI